METLSTPQKEPCPPVSDSMSLSSYKEYPAHSPLINTYHTPQTHTHLTPRLSSPSKAFPETNSAAILSALRNLQEKIRRLELEEGRGRLNIHLTGSGDTSQNLHRTAGDTSQNLHRTAVGDTSQNLHRTGGDTFQNLHRTAGDTFQNLHMTAGGDRSQTPRQNVKVSRRLSDPTQRDPGRETTYHSNCNQALITQLAAAESRCVQLERHLEHMRRMARHAKADRSSLLKQQVSARSAEPVLDAVSEHVQMEKLERLEQEYLRLTRTQSIAERKICELEIKLQEEEHQRKLVQDQAKQLQTGMEANRILLQSVSPRLPRKRSKEKRPVSKSLQQSSHTQPHYRLSLGDVPFVTGTSVGCSHSVRANVQSVLSLLKQHQPQLCNSRVLSHKRADAHSHSDTSSSSSSSGGGGGEELSELLHGLQEELRLMGIEQDELLRQLEAAVSQQERKELQRDQEMLLLRMERKGEQINKLYRHKTQMKKLRREASGSQRRGDRGEVRVTTTVATKGRSAGTVKAVAPPGARSQKNLRLLRDMRALQSSLRT